LKSNRKNMIVAGVGLQKKSDDFTERASEKSREV